MPDSDFGPKKQEIAKQLIGALIDYANDDMELIIKVETLTPLKMLIRAYAEATNIPEPNRLTDKLLSKELGAVLHRLEDQTGILSLTSESAEQDTENNQTGIQRLNSTSPSRGLRKEGWAFTLTLPSLEREECLEEFESWCQQRQAILDSRRSNQPSDDPPHTLMPTPVHNIPFSGAVKFIGRQSEIEQLRELLEAKSTSVAAILGMAGIGKSELAIQYAIDSRETYPGGICWIFAREYAVGPQIVRFAVSQLDLTIPDGLELEDQVNFCWSHWPSGKVLLVLDDVVDFEQIRDYLPTGRSQFKTLITTQLSLGGSIKLFPLEVLSLEASVKLLRVDQLIGASRVSQEIDIVHSLCD